MVQMWTEICEQPDVLERCANKNISTILSIKEDIRTEGINNVVIAARGTSDHAAIYAKYLIELKTGLPVSLAAPSVLTMYGGRLKLSNSLVIGISQSGKAADALEVIKAANEQDCITVSITNFEDSPMAVESKYHLFCDAGLEKSVAATKTFTSQLFLIAQLVAEWSGDSEMKEELSTLPSKLRKALSNSNYIKNKAERFRFMNECFVLARGMNFPIALETALKIQETSYVRARAYATSDFYHGPFAMIEKNMPVIVLAPEGPSRNDVVEMIRKLKEKDAEVVILSNNAEILEMGDVAFEIPSTDKDYISPFLNVVTAQMFACSLTLIKGLNPDSPRGLNKVTITR